MDKKNNLVWIDLEMTGLDVDVDVILEIALIITDRNLTLLHEGPCIVVYQSESMLDRMQGTVKTLHTTSGLIHDVRRSTHTVQQAEQQILRVIQEYCEQGTAILCGNTIWQDRLFLKKYMPKIIGYLHYRLLDVTAFKVAVAHWYQNNPYSQFIKRNTHRALGDVKESIDELRHYREHFFKG